MKVIIAGGRDYPWDKTESIKQRHFEYLDDQREIIPITEVVCGMAKGADMLGLRWAESRGIPVAKFPADWEFYGRAAGPIRNTQMGIYADGLIVFPGGKGTENMIKFMQSNKFKSGQKFVIRACLPLIDLPERK